MQLDYRSLETFVFCKLHVASCSYVDNLVENLLETTQEKIWKGIYRECIFNSQD